MSSINSLSDGLSQTLSYPTDYEDGTYRFSLVMNEDYIPYTKDGRNILIRRNFLPEVNVEYDKNLSDIEPSLYLVLADLCLYATQAYIFNHLRVKLDKGYIHAGYELSIIRDIVESYSDAGEMYKEELKTKFMPGAYSTEKETMVRHIRAMISNNW